ncbi:hypothetical protein ON010_g1015 [Phytophthora cinnamomi]|nr:hypothetical protein ON010_g1015 [Phytophthora cinnamomi]
MASSTGTPSSAAGPAHEELDREDLELCHQDVQPCRNGGTSERKRGDPPSSQRRARETLLGLLHGVQQDERHHGRVPDPEHEVDQWTLGGGTHSVSTTTRSAGTGVTSMTSAARDVRR